MRPIFALVLAGVLALGGQRSAASAGDVASAPAPRPDALTRDQVESLVLLGRVWGFAKYHHPRITGGAVDADAELKRAIGMVRTARSRNAARDSVEAWLASLQDPPACSPCASAPADAYMQPDLGWIRDERTLGKALSARLVRIHAARPATMGQRYVRPARGAGNPEFAGENAYAEDSLPAAELRLLGVFRFWNMLEYWFPYRDLMEHDRVAILREFVPAAWEAGDVLAYRRTMMRLVARAGDTHANLWSSMMVQPPGGRYRLPVKLRRVDGRFVIAKFLNDSAAPATGLRVGDVIVRVGGAPVDSLRNAWAPWFGASNDAARDRDIGRALTRGDSGTVRVDIRRDGIPMSLAVRRLPYGALDMRGEGPNDRPGDTFQLLGDSVAYLKLSSIKAADVAGYVERAAKARVLVIDIRNYPSEFVVFALGQHLVSEPRPFARFTMPDVANPGAFTWSQPLSLAPKAPHFGGRVVILVDESSQSQAEYTTMAFRATPGAIVVGSTTAGADGNVSPIPLPGGLRAMISGIGVFYPDKRPTQRVGIVPDVVVRPTVAGIRDGRDEVLEAALRHAFQGATPAQP